MAQTQTATSTVTTSGTTADGTGGATYFTFNSPVINGSGKSAFAGFLNGVPTSSDFGIWAAGSGASPLLVAREGTQAAGASAGQNYLLLSNPLIDADGTMVFFATLQGTGINATNDLGLWVGTEGSLTLAARRGDAAPDAGGATWSFVSESALIASGKLAFYGTMTGTSFGESVTSFNNDALWAGPAGGIKMVAREGDPAPGTDPGVTFGGFNTTPALNSAGEVAFRGTLSGTGVVANQNDRGLWRGSTTANTQLIARAGENAPGISGSSVKLLDFSNNPALNSAGTMAFRATLTGGPVGTGNDTAVYVGSQFANLALVAREGNQAGGLPAGVNYGEIDPFVVINSAGRIAFGSQLTGTGVVSANNRAVFVANAGSSPTRLVRTGDAAPGTPGGVNFGAFDFAATMNAGGQVAFLADLTGTGVVSGNNRGIWATDPWGAVVKVVREGDPVVVGPGDTRTIGDFGLGMFLGSGGGEGRWTSFNDAGQAVFSAFFSNNTRGIFTARVGGAARVNTAAPTLGAAVSNGFRLSSPATFGETVPVSGDIGYLRFVGVAPLGGEVRVLLDFSGTSVIASAIAELNRDAAVYGYAVSNVSGGSFGAFDVLLTYATAGNGNNPSHFYWNFANLNDVDLVAVQVTPEPGTATLAVLASLTLLRRRR